ncbi:hypothetical protein CMK11_11930 [Candidatus Poribacteria bacterium]|nr:hypothetical protein [Candidatus Poribacteria bacterium]
MALLVRRWGALLCAALFVHFAAVHAEAQTLQWEATSGPRGGGISKLRQTEGGTLFATGGAGTFRSTDGAETWTLVDRGARAPDVTLDGMHFSGLNDTVLFSSDDDGLTWVRTGYGLGRIGSLATSRGRLLVASAGLTGMLVSTDYGFSWARAPGLDAQIASEGILVRAGVTYVAGWREDVGNALWQSYDGGASWEARRHVGRMRHLSMHDGALYAFSDGHVRRSSDGWATWETFYFNYTYGGPNGVAVVQDTLFVATSRKGLRRAIASRDAPRVGPGIGDSVPTLLAYGNDLLVGADNGLWRTTDVGETWGRIRVAAAQVHSLVGAGSAVYATTGDGLSRSTSQGDAWTSRGAQVGSGVRDILAADGATLYAATSVDELLVSTDEGSTWAEAPVIDKASCVLLDAPNLVLVGADAIHRSGDGGQAWSTVGLWGSAVRALAAAGTGYVAAASTGVHMSNADGTLWRPTGLREISVRDVHYDAGVLWAVANSTVFRSADAGETWARLPLGGAGVTIADITGAHGYLYAATSDGVFDSIDLGNSWRRAEDGIPDASVTELLAHNGVLYAAVKYLGVYRTAIPDPIATPTLTILSPAPEQVVAGEAGQTEIRVASPTGATRWHWRLDTPFASTGAAGGAAGATTGVDVVNGLGQGTHTVFVTLVDSSGNVLDPAAQDSVTFHVADDSIAPDLPQRVRHAYEMPRGLSLFSPVLDGDRIRTADVSLDLPSTDGLHASHLAAIGSTVIVDLGEDGFRTAIARGGRILYGADFPLSGERGYVVNFRAPLTFTLEGEPYGTPIISDAVASAPGVATDALWAFAVGVRIAEPIRDASGLRARVRNVRTGDERTALVGRDGVAVVAFVDVGRGPIVALGDTLAIDILAPDGWTLGTGMTARVSAALLADAHAVADVSVTPRRTALLPNYPNPFNPETWLPFELAEAGDVTLTLYDANGRRIRAIALGRRQAGYHGAGSGAARWDGRNEQGEAVASGAYVAELRVGAARSARRILLLR